MRIAVGAVPDRDQLVLKGAVPALGVELGLVDDHCDAIGQGGNDAVRRCRSPSGISSAPEHVVRMQVEGVSPRHVMGENGFVDVHCALWPAGRAAGEMEKCQVLGTRCGEKRLCTGLRHRLFKVDRPGGIRIAEA